MVSNSERGDMRKDKRKREKIERKKGECAWERERRWGEKVEREGERECVSVCKCARGRGES